MIKIKRVYDPPEAGDGFRVLVDRVWPRGVSKDKGDIDHWMKEIAPSTPLRKWFNHEADKWRGFREKYMAELKAKQDLREELLNLEHEHRVITLLYGAKDAAHNQAVVLQAWLTRAGK